MKKPISILRFVLVAASAVYLVACESEVPPPPTTTTTTTRTTVVSPAVAPSGNPVVVPAGQ
ncbi:MAG: hypothetical protein JO271_18550 [Verrucomicrobia bacterium]|nr:hypothetical protein [Verrucomicrobiota bacterium]MBV9275928.1 hypothetical protein [Verrucomicrobiota bacterium]